MALGNGALSIHQVSSYIGAGTFDLGTLCKFAGINKWSKYKPIAYNSYDILADSVFASQNYGLSASASNNYATAASSGWVYAKPSSHYRLLDFRQYNHTALPPIRGGGTLHVSMDAASGTITFAINIAGTNDAIGLSELNMISSYYLALIIVANGNTYIVTSSSTLGSGSGESIGVTTNVAPFNQVGNYTYTAVAANRIASSPILFNGYTGSSYYPLPFDRTSDAYGTIRVAKTATILTYSIAPLIDIDGTLISATLQASLNGTHGSDIGIYFNGIAVKKNGTLSYVNYTFPQSISKTLVSGTTSVSHSFTILPSGFPTLETGDILKAYAGLQIIGQWSGTIIYEEITIII